MTNPPTMTATEPGRDALLERIQLALEQAQSCIKGETPEDITFGEAEDDTFSKLRSALDDVAELRSLSTPADQAVRIPFDPKAKLGFVWLIWGVTTDRIDLIAIATTEEARDRYLEAGRQMGRYMAVKDEQAFVDHLYGHSLLKAITSSRRPLTTEPKGS